MMKPVGTKLAYIVVGVAVLALAGAGSAVDPLRATNATAIMLPTPRVVVLKAKHKLHLFDGDTLVRTYPIDLGSVAAGGKIHESDGRTPVGVFRVVTKNADSPYHRFLGLDYPGVNAVEFGLAHGLISLGEAADIRKALGSGGCPDWGTALGGGIGIHGHRVGRDWTAGCIALADEHVNELFSVLRLGDTVEILP
jgi:murein L,D-transpeptidase YafK